MLNEYPNIHKFGFGEKLSKDAKRIEIPSLFVSLYHHRCDQVVVSRCDSLIGSAGCASDHSFCRKESPTLGAADVEKLRKFEAFFSLDGK